MKFLTPLINKISKKGFLIAIDGPVASGKGTLASRLTQELNAEYLDTGAMYRCVALFCLKNEIDILDKKVVEQVSREIEIEFIDGKTFLNKLNVSHEIRLPEVGSVVPVIAGNKDVRKELVSKQKEIAKKAIGNNRIFIAEGRDIGTVVLPNADLKIFLSASIETRAKRRKKQLEEKGIKQSLERVMQEITDRDDKDIKVNGALADNPEELGYIVIENSTMTLEENVTLVMNYIRERKLL